jgi:hypothetical protein
MKQAVLGYEQKFFIDGTQISGVQSVQGSYAIQEAPINVLGWGHVDAGYHHGVDNFEDEQEGFLLDENGFRFLQDRTCNRGEEITPKSLAVLSSPLEGSFSIESILVSQDFFLQYLGDTPFTGSIHHGNDFFGFHSGYITNHSIECAVGQLPTTSTNIRVFGDIGGTPDYVEQDGEVVSFIRGENDERFVQETSYNSAAYNASGDNPFPEIRLTNQGNISIQCTGIDTDRVTSFSHSIDVQVDPIYVVGSAYAAQVDVLWPIETNTSFTLEIDQYQYQSMRKYIRTPTVQDISVKINDCFGNPIQHYTVKEARLIGEAMSASTDGRMTVNLSYKSYYNKRGLMPHQEDLNRSKFIEQ